MKIVQAFLISAALFAPFAAMAALTNYYAPAMNKMHDAMMSVKPTGNADADFVRGMIPHHQGAVDMAKVELQYGKDPELRKFAQKVIDAQSDEIKMMQDWLKTHPQK